MSYWRKLFLVVLLALSLPVQSFAAASMNCVWTHANAMHADTTGAAIRNSENFPSNVAPHSHDMKHAALGESHHANDWHGDNAGRHAHLCFTCATCCVGAGLPAQPLVTASLDASPASLPAAASAGIVSFLTGGIERPPRTLLV
jgi:hypothetical protein